MSRYIVYQPTGDDEDDLSNAVAIEYTGAPQQICGLDDDYRIGVLDWSDQIVSPRVERIANDSASDWPAGLQGEDHSDVSVLGDTVTVTQQTATAFGSRSQAFATEIGETYVLSGTYKTGSTSRGNVSKSDSGNSGTNSVPLFSGTLISGADVSNSVEFVATAETSYVHVGVWNNGIGTFATYANISVKKK